MNRQLSKNLLKQAMGKRLRATREALGYDEQKPFAEEFGYKPSRYRNWERGEHAPPAEFLYDLWHRYRIPTDWIISGSAGGLPENVARALKNKENLTPR